MAVFIVGGPCGCTVSIQKLYQSPVVGLFTNAQFFSESVFESVQVEGEYSSSLVCYKCEHDCDNIKQHVRISEGQAFQWIFFFFLIETRRERTSWKM